MQIIYADNNATTQIYPEVLDAMMPYLGPRYGNPSSLHRLGVEVAKDMDHARQQVAGLLGCKPSEVVFTSGGTESNNMALQGALAAHPKKRHMITTAVEHSAVLQCTKYLAAQGCEITCVPVDKEGRLNEEFLLKSLRADTCLVSVMWANNETGVLFPVEDIAQKVKAKAPDVLFHTDAVQAVGKVPIDLSKTSVDLLSLSGHKFHAPKGVGVLVLRRGAKIKPLTWGGSQENGQRPGTENVASIMGLGKACALAKERLGELSSRLKRLRDKLEQAIVSKIPDAKIHGAQAARVPNTTSIGFKGLEAEAILQALSDEGICASSGSACKKGKTDPSHVLVAMGLPREWALGTLRFSLGHGNIESDVDFILSKLPGIIAKLSAIA